MPCMSRIAWRKALMCGVAASATGKRYTIEPAIHTSKAHGMCSALSGTASHAHRFRVMLSRLQPHGFRRLGPPNSQDQFVEQGRWFHLQLLVERLAVSSVMKDCLALISLCQVRSNQDPVGALPQRFLPHSEERGLDRLPVPSALDDHPVVVPVGQ